MFPDFFRIFPPPPASHPQLTHTCPQNKSKEHIYCLLPLIHNTQDTLIYQAGASSTQSSQQTGAEPLSLNDF